MAPTRANAKAISVNCKSVQERLVGRIREKYGSRLEPSPFEIRDEILALINRIIDAKSSWSAAEKGTCKEAILDELFGFGPLGPVLRRPDVFNVYLEGPERAYLEVRGGRGASRIEKARLPFRDQDHLIDVINRFLVPMELTMNEASPVVAGKLPNGSRLYASMKPASVHGPTLALVCQDIANISPAPGWHLGYKKDETAPVFSIVSADAQNNTSNCLQLSLAGAENDLSLYQAFPARAYRGKRVCFSGSINVSGEAEVDVIITGYSRGRIPSLYEQRRLTCHTGGAIDFKVGAEVPVKVVSLGIGIKSSGAGQVSIGQLSFTLVDNQGGGQRSKGAKGVAQAGAKTTLRYPRNLAFNCV
jgi:hypothetical protein